MKFSFQTIKCSCLQTLWVKNLGIHVTVMTKRSFFPPSTWKGFLWGQGLLPLTDRVAIFIFSISSKDTIFHRDRFVDLLCNKRNSLFRWWENLSEKCNLFSKRFLVILQSSLTPLIFASWLSSRMWLIWILPRAMLERVARLVHFLDMFVGLNATN